ncbi:MAG: hypothetical protein ABI647_13305 [Gemmatimonadota bacterium]
MTDDIGAMTAKLAADPSSLVFLPLAEALRQRGQLDAALTVAARGTARYPEVAEAHALVARIRSDRGEGDAAFDAWTTALRLDADHAAAHKGLAFLAYRAADWRRSLMHLTRAAELSPGDASLAAAAERIRGIVAQEEPPVVPPVVVPEPPEGRPATEAGPMLLLDLKGRALTGRVSRPDGSEASDAVAAALAGISKEAERIARLLGLGEWRAIAMEGAPANYEVRAPTPETLLLVFRGREVPAGRLSRIADKAVLTARQWLEEVE